MLFPDWGNTQYVYIGRSESYTVKQDSFIVCFSYSNDDISGAFISIDGKTPFYDDERNAHSEPTFYCAKGTILKNTSSSKTVKMSVIPLVKGGGVKVILLSSKGSTKSSLLCCRRIM